MSMVFMSDNEYCLYMPAHFAYNIDSNVMRKNAFSYTMLVIIVLFWTQTSLGIRVLLYLCRPDTLANSEDPDEMLHKAAFHQGLHCLQRQNGSSETEI